MNALAQVRRERLERAVNVARAAGGVLSLVVGPLVAGPFAAVLGALLLAYAWIARELDRGTRSEEAQRRIDRALMAADSAVAVLALLVFAADPAWAMRGGALPLVVVGAFRLGRGGAYAAAAALTLGLGLGAAARAANGMESPWPSLGFQVGVFWLLAALMPALLKETYAVRGVRAELYRPLLQAQSDLGEVVAVTEGDRIVYVSEAAARLTGYAVDELIGLDPARLLSDPAAAEALGSAGGAPVELAVRRKDGTTLHLEVAAGDLGDGRRLLLARDATERHEARTALARREDLYRRIVETAQEGVWLIDEHNRTTFANERLAEMLGREPGELLGCSMYDFMDDAGRELAARRLMRSSRDARDQYELRFVRPDGRDVWTLVSTSPLVDDHGGFLGGLAMVVDITERKRVEAELERRLVQDELTGLPNRLLLGDRIERAAARAKREQSTTAVILLDLDRFKNVNDTFGHAVGDELLRAVAERLRGAVRAVDTVARLGGDEFSICAVSIARDEIDAVVDRVERAIEGAFTVAGHEVFVTASIGIALAPEHGMTSEELLRRADIAMYDAKRNERGSAIYSAQKDTFTPAALTLLGELRRAVERKELVLHYQPIVDLRTGECVKAEALLRWQHPGRGLLHPDEFIPLAEANALMPPMTAWVFSETFRRLALLHKTEPGIGLAANLSLRQLRATRPDDMLRDLLDVWRPPPGSLTVEITETAALEDPELTVEVLSRIRELGIKVSLDDFGTGYSSLAYLQQLPIDRLKIDRRFVSRMAVDPSSAAIVRSTIDLAHRLGVRTVAEGIEDAVTQARLLELGCDLGQGFHIARPMTFDELRKWTREARRSPDLALDAAG